MYSRRGICSWRWLYLLSAPLAALTLVVALRSLREVAVAEVEGRLDYLGAGLGTAGIALVVFLSACGAVGTITIADIATEWTCVLISIAAERLFGCPPPARGAAIGGQSFVDTDLDDASLSLPSTPGAEPGLIYHTLPPGVAAPDPLPAATGVLQIP